MIAWGDILPSDQIQQLVAFVRQLKNRKRLKHLRLHLELHRKRHYTWTDTCSHTYTSSAPAPAGPVSFAKYVLPLFQAEMCCLSRQSRRLECQSL